MVWILSSEPAAVRLEARVLGVSFDFGRGNTESISHSESSGKFGVSEPQSRSPVLLLALNSKS